MFPPGSLQVSWNGGLHELCLGPDHGPSPALTGSPALYLPTSPSNETGIRLLHLHSDEGDEPVRGELVIVSIDERHDFEAISYTWADENKDSTRCARVVIGNGSVPVTRSRQAVLQRTRNRYFEICVWIDSLCVNQDDLEERSLQVTFMPGIYARAKKIYVYLEKTTENYDQVLESLRKVAQGLFVSIPHAWVNDLFRRPYLFRIWVVQEIALPQNPVMLGSHKGIPWSTLQLDTALRALNPSRAIYIPPLLSLGKRRLRELKELLEVLRLGRSCKTTDPRDRVFALLGLLIGGEAEGLVADHTQPTSEVFT